MPTAAVLGSPITHSLSPVIHRAAYKACGLKDWRYSAIKCDEAGLPARLDEMRADPEWRGASLTMPLKLAAAELVDELAGVAASVECVNTLVSVDGGVVGHNTDADGILGALAEIGIDRVDGPVVILGSGATARAALAAAAQLRAPRIDLVVRVASRATPTVRVARAFHLRTNVTPWSAAAANITDAALVIATIPRDVSDELAKTKWPKSAALLDVLYDPWPTPLAAAATKAKAPVVGGMAVLAHQGAHAFQLMTGLAAPLEAMRAAGEKALAARGS